MMRIQILLLSAVLLAFGGLQANGDAPRLIEPLDGDVTMMSIPHFSRQPVLKPPRRTWAFTMSKLQPIQISRRLSTKTGPFRSFITMSRMWNGRRRLLVAGRYR
jgi:hypothetical protein